MYLWLILVYAKHKKRLKIKNDAKEKKNWVEKKTRTTYNKMYSQPYVIQIISEKNY